MEKNSWEKEKEKGKRKRKRKKKREKGSQVKENRYESKMQTKEMIIIGQLLLLLLYFTCVNSFT